MIRKKIKNRINYLLFIGGDILYTPLGIPIIDDVNIIIKDHKIVPAIDLKTNNHNYIGHFYIDDFQFDRFWNNPERYFEYLKRYFAVIGPDFSTYSNMPEPVLMFNIYKNALLSLIWQRNGINVIPNITWPIGKFNEKYVDPFVNSNIIAISNIGIDKIEKHKFEEEMMILDNYHHFERIIIYGTECKALTQLTNIKHITQFINARQL